MGMYNMFANCPSFGRGTFLTENEVSAVEANYSAAFVDQWRWRFSQFLAWLSNHPTLSSDALSHFTQQATHLGVGCATTHRVRGAPAHVKDLSIAAVPAAAKLPQGAAAAA